MTMASVARALLRRWYVTLLGLVIAVALCGYAVQKVSATYEASGDILLLPPQGPKGSNPYLNLGGVAGVTDVVSRAMGDNSVTDALDRQGASAYTVQTDQTMGGPAILVTGKGKTAQQALQTLRLVMVRVPPTLRALQQKPPLNVPEASLITTTVLQTDVKAKTLRKSQTRALIGAAAIGLLLTLLLAVLTDVMFARRSRRKVRVNAAEGVPAQAAPRGTRRRRPGRAPDVASPEAPDPVPANSSTLPNTPVSAPTPLRSRRAGRRRSAQPDSPAGHQDLVNSPDVPDRGHD
jgi:hypothetical protein